ncbi:O-antigen ligase [Nocardioides panaciterrulae]|uniref:O-antigen ligase n=1 Tax=Nocardioides panaciterrulae TaxID=661492 RepID=A0A7Y9J9V9_9ACTN|nr:O-antigen ligase [Nocardioides panaciterrulae]
MPGFDALAAFACVLLALLLWTTLKRRPEQSPRWFILLVWAMLLAQLMPKSVATAVDGAALSVGLLVWLTRPASQRRGKAVVGWSLAVLLFWAALVVHPNVPDLATGALGFRQSVLAVAGLILGCALKREQVAATELTVIRALMATLGASIYIHLYQPSIENGITRAAGEYTALFAGEARLQGIFAGPFHAATAGAVLLAWALVRLGKPGTPRLLWFAAVAVGAYGLMLAEVRTAYVAVALGVIAWVLVGRSVSGFAGRAAVVLVGFGLVYYAFVTGDAANTVVGSIANYSTDSRLLNRLPGYQLGLDMFQRSPFIGWGAGSAGDTLREHFLGREYVTPHNLVLKLGVEGGTIGLLLWGGLAVAAKRSLNSKSRQGQLAVVQVAVLVGFGITGSAINALPISYLMFVLVGLAVGVGDEGPAAEGQRFGEDLADRCDRDARRHEVVDDALELRDGVLDAGRRVVLRCGTSG